ncbi:MAG: response regulator transcription factor [Candidatus Pacebacteria bacterium]|nr:response regulator transcription factor [Candidatus Paceibacterota bacterium]
MTILIIEDDKQLSDILKKALKSERYSVDTAFDGEIGYEKALTGKYSLIILDIMLPKRDGMEICYELRANLVHTPIIMLTARSMVEDRVAGLDLGADDYLVKPFGMSELIARIGALLRRKEKVDVTILKVADITFDNQKHEVKRAGKLTPLTLKEYRLLFILLSHKGEVLTRRQLLDEAWGPEFEEKNNELNVHMKYLRNKVDSNRKIPLIRTIRGVGFSLKE